MCYKQGKEIVSRQNKGQQVTMMKDDTCSVQLIILTSKLGVLQSGMSFYGGKILSKTSRG